MFDSGIAFPAAHIEGQIFYRSDLKIPYIWNGTAWVNVFDVPIIDRCRVYMSADVSIPNNIATRINFDLEDYDGNDMHDNVINCSRITIKSSGYYLVVGQSFWDVGGTGSRYQMIFDDTPRILCAKEEYWTHQAGNASVLNASAVVYLAAGKYVTLQVLQNTGAALNLAGTINGSWLSVIKLSD